MMWFYLILAGLLEVVWATTMKLSDGFSRVGYNIITVFGMILRFYLLSRALKIYL